MNGDVISDESRLVDEPAVAVRLAAGGYEIATCSGCRHPIARSGDVWLHCDPDNSRGCRAASFREEGEYADGSSWDESLHRRMSASALKGGHR